MKNSFHEQTDEVIELATICGHKNWVSGENWDMLMFIIYNFIGHCDYVVFVVLLKHKCVWSCYFWIEMIAWNVFFIDALK